MLKISRIKNNDFNGLNHKLIRERENELITYPKFLPLILLFKINTKKRNDYLKKEGLFEKYYKKRIERRQKCKKLTSDERYNYELDELLDFIDENPVFEDFIKIKRKKGK